MWFKYRPPYICTYIRSSITAVMTRKNIVLIYCFLVVFTGVVTVEGEQGVDQLKTKLREPGKFERKEDVPLTGEVVTRCVIIDDAYYVDWKHTVQM